MENNKEKTEKVEKVEPVGKLKPTIETKKKGFQKWKVYLVLALLVAGVVAYGYFWLQKTNQLREQAIEVVERAQSYDVLLSKVEEEKDRCETFISQKEGSFGSFEYCKIFIGWTETLSESEEGLK